HLKEGGGDGRVIGIGLRATVLAALASVTVAGQSAARPGIPTASRVTDCAVARVIYRDDVAFGAVAAQDPETVFVVGGASGSRSRVERWRADGLVPVVVPNVGVINDVSATSRNNVWALGERGALHWNGRTWARIRLPSPKQVDALEPFFEIAATRKGLW